MTEGYHLGGQHRGSQSCSFRAGTLHPAVLSHGLHSLHQSHFLSRPPPTWLLRQVCGVQSSLHQADRVTYLCHLSLPPLWHPARQAHVYRRHMRMTGEAFTCSSPSGEPAIAPQPHPVPTRPQAQESQPSAATFMKGVPGSA